MNPTNMNFPYTIVIIGGLVRPVTLQRLRCLFSNESVEWLPTRDTNPSFHAFASQIQRAETRLIVILSGLVRHQHARDIVGLARRHRKHVLHLYRSPNPQRIRSELFRSAGGAT